MATDDGVENHCNHEGKDDDDSEHNNDDIDDNKAPNIMIRSIRLQTFFTALRSPRLHTYIDSCMHRYIHYQRSFPRGSGKGVVHDPTE